MVSNYSTLSYSEITNLAGKLSNLIARDYKFLLFAGVTNQMIGNLNDSTEALKNLPTDNDIIKHLIIYSQNCNRISGQIKNYLLQLSAFNKIVINGFEINEKNLQVLNHRELLIIITNINNIEFQDYNLQTLHLKEIISNLKSGYENNIEILENISDIHSKATTTRKQLFEEIAAYMQNIAQLGAQMWKETNKEYYENYQSILTPTAAQLSAKILKTAV